MKIDDEYRFREERAEDLRQRDREREPRARSRRADRDLTGGDAFRITLAERGVAVQDSGAVVAAGRAPRAPRRSDASRPRGNPAAWVLAGGISRHGPGCTCPCCCAPADPVVAPPAQPPSDDAIEPSVREADGADGDGR